MPTEARPSIRRRLLLGAFVVLLVMSLAAVQAALNYGRRAADLSYDRLLTSAALQIVDAIQVRQGRIQLDLPQAAFETLALASEDRVFYRVTGPGRDYLTGYADLPWPAAQLAPVRSGARLRKTFFNAPYSRESVRFIYVERLLTESDVHALVTLELGQTLRARHQLARDISLKALELLAGVMLLAMLLLWFGIDRALRPLQRIEQELDRRSPVDLSPLQLPVPQETLRLQDSINHFMGQLRETLERMQRYTGEAAHQIRTPLASLKALAQNLRDEVSPPRREQQLQQLLITVDQVNSTVSQLLNQAMITHRFQVEAFSQVDLSQLLRELCLDSALPALRQQVELALDGAEAVMAVPGNEFALKQLFRNLIDNAVRHAPPGSTVAIGLRIQAESILVEVVDCGSGIADSDKAVVFERFQRGSQPLGSGSGLGLSIALDVAQRHGAGIELLDHQPQGLCVRVSFPRAL